ncbi:hypothetical protein D3C73_1446590 [compost metagenome]
MNGLCVGDIQDIGEASRRDVRHFQEHFEAQAAGFVLFHKHESMPAARGFE